MGITESLFWASSGALGCPEKRFSEGGEMVWETISRAGTIYPINGIRPGTKVPMNEDGTVFSKEKSPTSGEER